MVQRVLILRSFLRSSLRPSAPALLALIAGFAITSWLWNASRDLSESEAQAAFDQKVAYVNLATDRVLEEVATAMRSMRAYLEVVPSPSPAEFQRHVDSSNLRLFSSGLQYLAVIEGRKLGEPDCDFSDVPELGRCFVVRNIAPLATNQAIEGVDLIALPGRKAAMLRAIDSGYLAAIAPSDQQPDNSAQPGLIVYLAVYREGAKLGSIDERRAALTRIVSAAFSLEDLVRAEVGGRLFNELGVRIDDVGLVGLTQHEKSTVVFDGQKLLRVRSTSQGDMTAAGNPKYFRVQDREFAGRAWRSRFEQLRYESFFKQYLGASLVLVLGSLLSLLIAFVLEIVMRSRNRAMKLARKMTVDLREREERLRHALEAASMGAWEWNRTDQRFIGDERAQQLLKLGPGGFETLLDQIDADDRQAVLQAFRSGSDSNGQIIVECRLLADPAEQAAPVRWVELSARLDRSIDQDLVRAVGLVRDITERREAAEARRVLSLRLITAQEEERQRIARELHDQMGQDITALGLGLRNLDLSPRLTESEHQQVHRLQQIVSGVDRQVDEFMVALRPVALDDLGLEAALQEHVRQWSELHGIKADFHTRGLSERLPFAIETTLYRLVQESLTNIARHAGATRVGVLIEQRRDQIRAIVEDDGRGFEPLRMSTTATRSYGLAGMRERVELVGGALTIESAPGSGTTVFARIPVNLEGDV